MAFHIVGLLSLQLVSTSSVLVGILVCILQRVPVSHNGVKTVPQFP